MSKKDSPEGDTTQEQQERDFINEFIRIGQENVLKPYEEKNRTRINESSLVVRDAFDKVWIRVTGRSYYQPVTAIRPTRPTFGVNNTERSDPRSRKYMARVVFDKIYWQKIRRKIGKRFKDLYLLKGRVAETQTERPIFQNLSIDRLKQILGDIVTDKIVVAASGKLDYGEITGKFEVQVEGFWKVVFAPQKGKNDPVDVRLMWEGQCLIIQRMKDVVVPGFYLEIADNATRDHYTQNAKEGRKKVGVIMEYPYTVINEATMEEYLEQKNQGTKIMRDKLAKEE